MSAIVKYYESFDEWGRLDREPVEMMINWHFMKAYLPKPEAGPVLDNGAGPGKYSMKLAASGYRVTVTDITPKLVNMAQSKAKELGLEGQFDGFHSADAMDLSCLERDRFAASLMLGPMYHLQAEEDRAKAVKELYRVTKPGGVVFVAFMPRTRHLISSLLHPRQWKPNDSAEQIAAFMESGAFDHSDEGRFTGAYYTRVEDIQPFMSKYGFAMVKMIGSSNIASLLQPDQWSYWRSRGEAEMETLFELLKETADNPYLLGVSPHILYIGVKVVGGS
ncbi:class I SAM-dependent methyltransferase [Paenibacillus sp. H1-7]|uniref:class I SAM-dependent methyltransferase n=1 Tax=Paenibacillus sp. H1-7 TaxID=2282849 RepID=UPI001EF9064A|nr:class I SAM-dependent methyltransferase [Paenibacillus sp. H1-7]ULL19062.1 class I SAM-dependent methyltransferase [Paenibacillus sp. H1-7]